MTVEGVDTAGTRCRVRWRGTERSLTLPVLGTHNVLNAGLAAALALLLGWDAEAVLGALEGLEPPPGRLQAVPLPGWAPAVFVDYAHSPDALETVLRALAPAARGRLAVVFGCGGERDREKRPRMGAIAAELADLVVVTSDNPRSEDPEAILAEIEAGLPPLREHCVLEVDRARAIHLALSSLGPDDVLLVAGKGHERTQTIGDSVLPFSDVEACRNAWEDLR